MNEAAAADPSGLLTMGLITCCFGGFIALNPYRFFHPFKGRAANHPEWIMVFMRVCGGVVGLGGVWIALTAAWYLLTRAHR
jgi:uncharacterized membrane-anchored protein